MKQLIFLASLVLGLSAHADGFKCETESGLIVQVYNQTQAGMGTRSGAVMVISDSNIKYGNKTVASFTAEKKTLSSKSLTYVGNVDLRVKESNRKGELLLGTKLGYVDQIALTVDFSYARPTAHGHVMAAELAVAKRNGDLVTEGAVCERYLKN